MRALLLVLVVFSQLVVRSDGARPGPERLQDLRDVGRADWNEDGSRVILRMRDGRSGIWDVTTDRPVASPAARPKCPGYVLSGDRKRTLLCGREGVRVVETMSGAPVSPILDVEAGELASPALVLSPTGETLVELRKSEVVVRWVKTGEVRARFPLARNEGGEIDASACFPKGERECFIMDENMRVTRFDARTWKPIGEPMQHPAAELAYTGDSTISTDGRWMATYDSPGENGPKGNLQLWDCEAGTALGPPLEAMNGLTAQFLAATNRVIVTPARGEARVLELPSLKLVRTLRAHDDLDGPSATPAADGRHLFVWGSDQSLDYCDPDQETLVGASSSKARLKRVLPAPDGAAVYLVYDNTAFLQLKHHDHYVLRLSLRELKETASLRILEDLGEVSLSPNGRRLMIKQGQDDRAQLILYDAKTLKPLR